jgi:broad specificity phosphatase PhoE
MKKIYLVRHAQTRYDPAVADEERPLTSTGHEQAAALCDTLLGLGIEEIHSSPFRRCVDTIAPFAWTDFDFAFPDGESSRQAQLRMHEATLDVGTASRAPTLAISSHGNVIGLLLQHIDPRFAFEHACSIRNPDVLHMTFDGAALRWDADFALGGLNTFATRVVTASAPAA